MIKKSLLLMSTFFLLCSFHVNEVAFYESKTPILEEITLEFDIPGGAYLTFAEKFGGEITKEDLQKTKALGVAGCAKGSKITTFILQIKTNGTEKTYRSKNYKLSNEVLMAFRALKKGDVFEFKNVKAKLPTGGIVDVHCKSFVVV